MKLAAAEARRLSELLDGALESLPPGGFAARLASLRGRLGADPLDDEDEDSLALFAESLTLSGRASGEGGAAERLLGSLYRRTRRGAAAAAEVADASALLESLTGRPLDAASLTLAGPGRYLLHMEVDGMELSLELGPAGVNASAAMGAA